MLQRQAAGPGPNSNLKIPADLSKETKARPAHSSSPCTSALPSPHTKQPQRVTGQGSHVGELWVRNTFAAENSGPYSHSGQFVYVLEVEGKHVGHFQGRALGQRDARAGFGQGFIIDLEMAGCSALVFVQTSPCQALPHWKLSSHLGLTPSALGFCYSQHKDICQEIS